MLADASTHFDWLKGVFRRKAAVLSEAGGRVSTRVSVDAGLMKGVREDYTSDTLSIGSAIGCDIVLMDEGILPHHLTLHLRRSAFGVLVEASAEGPAIIGELTLDAGKSSGVQRLPQMISVGQARLMLSHAPETAPRHTWLQGTAGLVGIVCFVLALALAAPLVQMLTSSDPRPVILAEKAASPSVQLAVNLAFGRTVQAELARLELQDSVTLDASDGNALSISGRIPGSKWQAWRSFTTWYDQQNGAPVLRQDVARATETATLKPVAMIRLSEPAEILFVDGESRKVGETVDGNWVIKSITSTGLILTRGFDTTEITF
jgi:hypothetical protein